MLTKNWQRAAAAALGALVLTLTIAVGPVAAEPTAATVPVPAVSQVTTDLTAEEAAGLTFMREEEKLARDVYQYLYQQWRLPIFRNIAASEQTHMDAVKTLLDRYGIADPAAGAAPGVFSNPDLQELYNQLIAQGSQSRTSALEVGIAIEELDIRDLQQRLEQTNAFDITTVYSNLLRGSQNHLSAFTRNLGR